MCLSLAYVHVDLIISVMWIPFYLILSGDERFYQKTTVKDLNNPSVVNAHSPLVVYHRCFVYGIHMNVFINEI